MSSLVSRIAPRKYQTGPFGWRTFLLTLILLTSPGRVLAQWGVTWQDYFVNTAVPRGAPIPTWDGSGACSTARPVHPDDDPTAWDARTAFRMGTYCNAQPTVLIMERKSGLGGQQPWATNTDWADSSGSLLGLDEKHDGGPWHCPSGGYDYRSFRDHATLKKGGLLFPAYIYSGLYVTPPPYSEEVWDGCTSIQVCRNPGSAYLQSYSVDWSGYTIKDCRQGSDCSVDHPLMTITKWEYWGNYPQDYHLEVYTYGRWYDPVFERWDGVGIVSWTHWRILGQNWILVASEAYDRLVETRFLNVECWTCPDP